MDVVRYWDFVKLHSMNEGSLVRDLQSSISSPRTIKPRSSTVHLPAECCGGTVGQQGPAVLVTGLSDNSLGTFRFPLRLLRV